MWICGREVVNTRCSNGDCVMCSDGFTDQNTNCALIRWGSVELNWVCVWGLLFYHQMFLHSFFLD